MLLKNQIKIFVLSFKGSKRLNSVKKQLIDLDLQFEVSYGLNAKNYKSKAILKKKYDKNRSLKIMEKAMDIADLACAFGHIKIYKKIIKKNIPCAIILEDDARLSKSFRDWVLLQKNQIKKYDFIQFYSNSGLLYKKIFSRIGKKFFLYKAKTHLPLASSYQINIRSCKLIMNYFKQKIIQTSDFPAYYFQNEIKQYFLLPIIATLNNNHQISSTNKKIWKSVVFFDILKKYIPFYYFFNSISHVFLIPFFFHYRKIHSLSFYISHFFKFKILVLKNFFVKKYLNVSEIISSHNKELSNK